MTQKKHVIVVGAGASGFFTAINTARLVGQDKVKITLLESAKQPLQKLKMSGGGRCNVTHHCFQVPHLIQNYPRGQKKLKGLMFNFGPEQTIDWFQERGVSLHVEDDGRMFPTSNSSQTIIDCFATEARRYNIEILYGKNVVDTFRTSGQFHVKCKGEDAPLRCDLLVLATGSAVSGHNLAKTFGHSITPLAPSLFTFKVRDERIQDLPGVSFSDVALSMSVSGAKFHHRGPLLITHWGFSGPAVLKLSAWGARELKQEKYKASLSINFFPGLASEESSGFMEKHGKQNKHSHVENTPLPGISKRYWKRSMEYLALNGKSWDALAPKHLRQIHNLYTNSQFQTVGRGIFKEEFVTCGGVSLKEINLKTMESRVVQDLFFTGEMTDVDGITGGFNFQYAWATAMCTAQAISAKLAE